MPVIVLDGKSLAEKIEADLKRRISSLARLPVLALVLIGGDVRAKKYVTKKEAACRRIGMQLQREFFSEGIINETVLQKIETLNLDPNINGILLQYPVPPQIDELLCFDKITPEKDIDGVSRLKPTYEQSRFPSAISSGILRMLKQYKIPLKGKHAVIVANNQLSKNSIKQMLLNENVTVTTCPSKANNLPEQVGQADILIGAIGIPGLIKADWIKKGAVVVNANYHLKEKMGDIELEGAIEKCSAYNPIPGSIGPMTISVLLEHTVIAAEKAAGIAL
jgi:methylenetetrahydrofolate dehydrogenase (NADP+)/methenyltetrahydrofolate cyclohydrolase